VLRREEKFITCKYVSFKIMPEQIMDNVESLRYSGRLFQTVGPVILKKRMSKVDNLNGSTMS